MVIAIVKAALQGAYDMSTASYTALVYHIATIMNLAPRRTGSAVHHVRRMDNEYNTQIRMRNTVDINDKLSGYRWLLTKLMPLLNLWLTFALLPKYRSGKAQRRFNKYVKLRHKKDLVSVVNYKAFRKQAYQINQQGKLEHDLDFTTLLYRATVGREKNKRKSKQNHQHVLVLVNYKRFVIRSLTKFNRFVYKVRQYYEQGGLIIINGKPVTRLTQLFGLHDHVFVKSHWEAVGVENIKSITFGEHTRWNRDALAWIETVNPKGVNYYRVIGGDFDNPIPIYYDEVKHKAEHETFRAEDPETYGMTEEEFTAYQVAKEELDLKILSGKDTDYVANCKAWNDLLIHKVFKSKRDGSLILNKHGKPIIVFDTLKKMREFDDIVHIIDQADELGWTIEGGNSHLPL